MSGTVQADNFANSAGTGAPTFTYGANGIGKSPAGTKDIANANYIITDSDGYLVVTSNTALTGNATVTLPASSTNIGRRITLAKMDTGAFSILVVPNGTDTISGLSQINLSLQYSNVTVYCEASGLWTIVGTKPNNGTLNIGDAAYTVLDYDGYGQFIAQTTLTANRTVTLPLAANNLGRRITVTKLDSSTNTVNVALSGADTLNGFTSTFSLLNNTGATVTVQSMSSGKWSITEVRGVAPTFQNLTASGTYTRPDYCIAIDIELVGGGGGGSSNGVSSASGSPGTASTFGSSFLTADFGKGGTFNVAGGAGGTAQTSFPSNFTGYSTYGAPGGCSPAAAANVAGSNGGNSAYGGGGAGQYAAAGNNGLNGSGGGGAGGGSNGTSNTIGCGGGSGAYIKGTIKNPASTYSYVCGGGGAGGGVTSGNGFAGGNGGSGGIYIFERYI